VWGYRGQGSVSIWQIFLLFQKLPLRNYVFSWKCEWGGGGEGEEQGREEVALTMYTHVIKKKEVLLLVINAEIQTFIIDY
jgi:hypothetical protein